MSEISRARPPIAPSQPTVPVPAGACDTHLHIFGSDFALASGNAEDPASGTLDEWLDRLDGHFRALGLNRGVIVHSVAYAEDNAVTEAAIERRGTDRLRGVALVRPDISKQELSVLHAAGFRGVRLNLSFTGALDLDGLEALAPRLADLGWHVLVNLPRYVGLPLATIADRLAALPLPVVLDHYGYPDLEAGVKDEAFQACLSLLASGRFWVKLSAGYRQCAPSFEALDPFVDALVRANPDRLLWASDWPHVRWNGIMPDNAVQLDALARQVPDASVRTRILATNPQRLYSFPSAP